METQQDQTIHSQSEVTSLPRDRPFTESEIQLLLQQKRESLIQELGLASTPVEHYHKPVEAAFTKQQRASTTILFGGLTWKHERLIEAFTESLGYRFEALPTPDIDAFHSGKEFGNNGQCNPTYFTVGNLLEALKKLVESGLNKQQIIDNYVFFTAGACGPCRFGMYEAEYRLALKNAGFDGFRVLIFQQKGGINQNNQDAGINLNSTFFIHLLNAFVLGDLVNELAYRIRPYEIVEGETDRVLEASISLLADQIKQQYSPSVWLSWVPQSLQNIWLHLAGRQYEDTLQTIAQKFDDIEVDWLRVKPVVKITGEFWAQTTEGDGNYKMFSFLEKEQAQVLVEPIGTWITYMLHQTKQKVRDRRVFTFKTIPHALISQLKLIKFTLAEYLFDRQWRTYVRQLRGIPHLLINQYELKKIAHPFYNSRAQGGEGHLEIAKNIYYTENKLCHMVLSLKPFGCMPSTQSDGVQSSIINQYPEMIFLPLETAGEGAVNAQSRTQMSLGEARIKANSEFSKAIDNCQHSLSEIQQYITQHSELRKGMLNIPASADCCGLAANFVRYVDFEMSQGK